MVIDTLYLMCLAQQSKLASYALEREGYQAEIQSISYSNPFEILAFFQNVTPDVVEFLLKRLPFIKPDYERRGLENEKLRQEIISQKLDNIAKAAEVREQLLSRNGGDPETVTRMLGRVLNDQHAVLRIEKPKPRDPARERMRM